MQIPETPKTVQALDLMQRLKSYSEGKSTWHADESALGDEAQRECQTLYLNVMRVVEQVLAPLMDRATARELETFTMHDRTHGFKVAHLMWHILPPGRQRHLTPPEIGMLVLAAFLHDVGMALSPEERQKRLAPDSSLWDNLEIDSATKQAFEKLRAVLADKNTTELHKRRAQTQLLQGEEVLLAVDTRERHATAERYKEVLEQIAAFHEKDKARIPDIESCFSYYGDSFRDKLVDVCVNHNQDAETLIERDRDNPQRLRFSRDFPVGDATADLHMIAAALRLADILDFDRERTPPILFHYLVPGPLAESNISAIEWTKHLTISNWHIEPLAIIFRGRSTNHITHHAVVQFCSAIQEELSATHATFSALGMKEWPFALSTFVKHEIHEEGYHYVPYRFELDDQRVYELLMGGAIYDNPLVALRELVQNSVDACKLRDSLTAIYDRSFMPDTQSRITVRYFAQSEKDPVPVVEVEDSGTGMDSWIIERFFLKVGQSYYRSSEFNRTRLQLRGQGRDFAPVSEFGIGFLSCFLLADRVEVETAMWESPRGDTRKRYLQIDGPTRLIQLREHGNEGVARFKGTKIRLWLVRGAREEGDFPPDWNAILSYLREVCQDLPYRINLELVEGSARTATFLDPSPVAVPRLPESLESSTVRIEVNMDGIEGELALLPGGKVEEYEKSIRKNGFSYAQEHTVQNLGSVLLRGGFLLGEIPSWNIASTFGRLRLKWENRTDQRYIKPNLARSSSSYDDSIVVSMSKVVLNHLFEHAAELPEDILGGTTSHFDRTIISALREKNPAFLQILDRYDAHAVYLLCRNGGGLDASEIDKWERSEAAMPFSVGGLARTLFEMILPRVAQRYVARRTSSARDLIVFVSPPSPDWRETLKSWKSYIHEPARWPVFVEIREKGFENVLFTTDNFLNISFEERLGPLSQVELQRLISLLDDLAYFMYGATTLVLSADQLSLLRKIAKLVPEARVRIFEDEWEVSFLADKFTD